MTAPRAFAKLKARIHAKEMEDNYADCILYELLKEVPFRVQFQQISVAPLGRSDNRRIAPRLVNKYCVALCRSPCSSALTWLDGSLSKYSNSMIAVHHHHLCIAVGIDRMIGETNLVSLASGINDVVC